MSEPGELIADALREIGDQAATPRPMADAAWRAAHRRRRLSVVATSAAAAGAVAVTVAVSLIVGGAGGTAPGPSAAAHISLRAPVRFEQVAAISHAPCTRGEVPGLTPHTCVRLTGTGMAIVSVKSAQVPPPYHGQNVLDLRLTPSDSRLFATITRKLAVLHMPRNELAVIVRGRVVSQPTVMAPITAGRAQIDFGTHAQAERVLRSLISHRLSRAPQAAGPVGARSPHSVTGVLDGLRTGRSVT